MRTYELIFIAQPELDETAMQGIIDRVTGWINEAGGTINKIDNWGKRRLAYIINKRREGQYVLFEMQLSPASTGELERNLRFLEPVMRFSLINRE